MFNPAINAALLAATQDADSKHSIQALLRKAKAVNSFRAIALELNEKQQLHLDQQLASGSIVKTADGRFYLSERMISERTQGKGFMLLLILLILGSAIASIAVLVSAAGG